MLPHLCCFVIVITAPYYYACYFTIKKKYTLKYVNITLKKDINYNLYAFPLFIYTYSHLFKNCFDNQFRINTFKMIKPPIT